MASIEVNHTYPAGRYYIGDICYALDDDVYQKQWGDKYNWAIGTHEITSNGLQGQFTVNYTAYGDGVYSDASNGNSYTVDSGTIGIVPFDLCSKFKVKHCNLAGGHIINSHSPVEFKSQNGIFVIGYNHNKKMVIIDTKDDFSSGSDSD